MPVQWFESWEDAARASVFNKAVSESFPATYKGRDIQVEYIKPLHDDAWAVQAGRGFRLPELRPHPIDIDRIRRWKRY
jgi:hypothetical protein